MGKKVRKLSRRQHSKGKPSPKVSSIKLGNKRNNQLVKQRVIKPKNDKNGQQGKRPKWALEDHKDSDEDDNQIQDYERKPRKNVFKEQNDGNNDSKFDSNQINEKEVEEKHESFNNNSNCIDNNENIFASKSLVELFAERNAKLSELKTRIANISTSIISHPEINVKKLRDLLSMFDIKSDDKEYGLVFISIQKLVAFAALEVFRDIIPNYRVREKINEEDDEKNSKKKNFRLKKETQRLRDYEKSLLQLYRLYLLRLERMVQCINKGKSKKSNFYDNMLNSRKAKQRIATIGVKCFSELLITHPHFNFRTQIIETIVQLMANNSYKEISDVCCETICKLYKSDKLGEISLEAVKCTSKLVKARSYKINPKVLNTFLSLRIKEVKQKDETSKKDMKKIRTKLNLMSRKDRKRNKRMQKLDNQLLEAEATESRERKLNFHTEILNQVFVTYFRILKHQIENIDNDSNEQKWFKAILSPVLEGLSKFAHLINIEFFDDLIAILYGLIRDKQLDDHQCLHCLQTIFTILSGEGSALNIDFQRFYSELYVILLNIDINTNIDDMRALLSCLNTMIIKRTKQMTHNRVLAFIKRLSTLSLQTLHEPSIGILSFIRQIMLNHKQSDILLDSEGSSIGSGIFLPEIEDPEHCNANSTLLWEITLLKRHYEPLVRQFASHVLNGSKGNEVPLYTLKHQPLDLFNQLVGDYNEFQFFLKNSKKLAKNKSRNQYTLIDSNSSLTSRCYQYLQQLDISK